jgi:hypothetical protein
VALWWCRLILSPCNQASSLRQLHRLAGILNCICFIRVRELSDMKVFDDSGHSWVELVSGRKGRRRIAAKSLKTRPFNPQQLSDAYLRDSGRSTYLSDA